MVFRMRGWSPFKQKETFAEKARRARMMRPPTGEYYEGEEEGSSSTHLMATYTGEGGKHYVAPTITNKTKDGEYKSQSFDEAMKAGETFEFDSKEEADAFAKGSWKLTLISDIGK